MDIFRNLSQSLSSLDRAVPTTAPRTPVVDSTRNAPAKTASDRRYQPDRRRRQEPFSGADRRRRGGRRRPLLLHPRTHQEAPLEDRRGRLLNTKA